MAKIKAKRPPLQTLRYEYVPRAQLLLGDNLGRYSEIVYRLKLVLPILALGVLVALWVWPQLFGNDSRFTLSGESIAQQAPEASVINGPRYVGNNGSGLRYNIQAKTAKPVPNEPQAINLDQLRIESQTDGKAMLLTANRATYWRDRNGLSAEGKIELTTANGQSLQTEQAFADFKAGTVWGEQAISGQSPQGSFSGQGFTAAQNGAYVKLNGRVRLQLNPRVE